MTDSSGVMYDATRPLDPMGDAETLEKDGARKNFAKVGSARPSSLLYTYGPGSIMDLPHFTVMPSGLDDWDRVWKRRGGIPTVHAPRLLEVVRVMLGSQVGELRPFPWEPKPTIFSQGGRDLGVPAVSSHNGCAARVATGWHLSASSITPIPNLFALTRRFSSTLRATVVVVVSRRRARPAGPSCLRATCWRV